jgi:hypothetical protein
VDDALKDLLRETATHHIETAVIQQRDEADRLQTEHAADGTVNSGSVWVAIGNTIPSMFGAAAIAMLSDYLALARDAAAGPDQIQELRDHYFAWLAELQEGLLVRVGWQMERSRFDAATQTALAANVAENVRRTITSARREASIRFGRELLRQQRQLQPSPGAPSRGGHAERRDVFVSHAGSDRESFVNALVEGLVARGLSVWFSESEIVLGDSLRERIDDGLASSQFGVVVLSPAFFDHHWATTELDAMAARSNAEGRKVILPVWHRMTVDEVRKIAPSVAAVAGIPSSVGVPAVADAIVRAVQVEKERRGDPATT